MAPDTTKNITSDLELNAPLLEAKPTRKQSSSPMTARQAFFKVITLQICASLAIFLMQLSAKVSTSMNGVSSAQILTVRGYVTLIFGIIVILKDKVDLSLILVHKTALFWRMVLGFAHNTLFTIGIQFLNLSMASVIFNINPFLGVILGAIILKEKISRMQVVALMFTLIGVVLLLMPCVFTASCGADTSLNGYVIFPLLAALARAFAMVGIRKCKGIHWILPTLALAASFCVISPIILIVTGDYVPFDSTNTPVLLMGAVFGIGSNMFTAKALAIGDMGFNMPITYLTVILSSFVDVVVMNVDIAWNQWAGTAVIFMGIVCVTFFKYQTQQKLKKLKA
eukprot:CAMPEP_0115006778 /NCGR_PEP_ID=MMETSP0216-20121206/20716_1 /TAXON_ID=223996 /ORGANISM="Protocruzia adherens, Strain Boccale" /LENGTH=338 /DNA_ID=CAMNT_0002373453 /DNA_START=174 /DNA_END=1190 /DNA_ORIENTATION=-